MPTQKEYENLLCRVEEYISKRNLRFFYEEEWRSNLLFILFPAAITELWDMERDLDELKKYIGEIKSGNKQYIYANCCEAGGKENE